MSTLWGMPYVFTLIGAAFWFFIDYLVTNDEEDDILFEWHMPSNSVRVSWRAVGIRALVLVTLCFLAIQYPAIRSLGT